MNLGLRETLDIAGIIFGESRDGFIRFTGTKPVIFWDTEAVEVNHNIDLIGTLSAAEFQELRPFIRRVETLELADTYVSLRNEDGSTFFAGRTPDEEYHSSAFYYDRLGPVFETEEVPVGSLWGTLYRSINGDTVAFDILSHPYKLAEYKGIQLTENVPLLFRWAYDREGLTNPVLEIQFGFCRLISVGI